MKSEIKKRIAVLLCISMVESLTINNFYFTYAIDLKMNEIETKDDKRINDDIVDNKILLVLPPIVM